MLGERRSRAGWCADLSEAFKNPDVEETEAATEREQKEEKGHDRVAGVGLIFKQCYRRHRQRCDHADYAAGTKDHFQTMRPDFPFKILAVFFLVFFFFSQVFPDIYHMR